MPQKYEPNPPHVISFEPLAVRGDLSYEQEMRILDRKEQILWSKVIPLVRVKWKYHSPGESTWEREAEIK